MTIKKQQLTITVILFFTCLAWFPSAVFSQVENRQVKAGHIVVGSGRLVARSADGSERRLRRRAAIYAGDTIVVGKNAFVQIRFTDGGLFSLRPDSEFKVSEYRHQEQEAENGKVVFELLKGGLRTISGSIGKKNRENYQLKTPISTIGIRGTHYGVRICTGNCMSPQGEMMPDGLYGGVVNGEISVTNQRGEGIVGNDQYFHVERRDTPLRPLLGPPGIVFDPPVNGVQEPENESPQRGDTPPPKGRLSQEGDAPLAGGSSLSEGRLSQEGDAFLAGDTPPSGGRMLQRGDIPLDIQTATSTTQALTTNLTPAPLRSIAVLAVNDGKLGADAMIAAQKDLQNPEIFIDANNNPEHIEHFGLIDCQPCVFDKGAATLTNDAMPSGGFTMLKADEKVYWGRWIDGWYGSDSTSSGVGQGSWHFMYSPNVTTRADLDMLQVNNVIAHFSQWSAGDGTLPTDELGNVGSYSVAPNMDVNFGTREITNYEVAVDFSATGRSFYGTQQATTVKFSASAIDLALDVSCSGCTSSFGVGRSNIVFVGTSASHAINSFEMHTDDGVNSAVGAALLTRSPLPPP